MILQNKLKCWERERQRQRQRQKERETDRRTDRERQTDRESDRESTPTQLPFLSLQLLQHDVRSDWRPEGFDAELSDTRWRCHGPTSPLCHRHRSHRPRRSHRFLRVLPGTHQLFQLRQLLLAAISGIGSTSLIYFLKRIRIYSSMRESTVLCFP